MATVEEGGGFPGRIRAEQAVVEIAAGFLAELHPAAAPRRPTLDSRLDADLGLDSLSRVELAVRIERGFGVRLPEAILADARTLRDLVGALEAAAGEPEGPRDATGEAGAPLAPDPPDGPMTVPTAAATLVDVLDWHAEAHPDKVQIIHLGETGETRITYGELRGRVESVAAGLQREGLLPRQTVAIMLPTGPEYFFAYLGVLRAGGVPVPIYPPARLAQIEEHVRRHAGILANAEAALLVTVPEARTVARLLEARVAGLRKVVTVAELEDGGGACAPVSLRGGDIAFIQYTSGSTGDPKGVVLTHDNLLANIRAIGQAVGIAPGDVFVSWLPLYHDMGLICAWLTTHYFAIPLVVMSPLAFLARPERWLRAIHQYRGTISAAPNFAYELCVKRIADDDLAGLDLGSWRIAANGAEPVVPDTLRRFSDRFAPFGFRPEAMMPVYGLAESTVGLISPPVGRGPRVDRVRRAPFSVGGRAEPAAEGDDSALSFASCGRPIPGHEVRIVDALGTELDERFEGRLEFRGPSATAGYYRNPEQTRRLRDGEWLDSGDRAYMAGGEVHITGRVKDIIIRGGRNIYPHEVEDVVGSIPGVRRGCVAVFGSPDAAGGTERLVVLAEIQPGKDGEALRRQIVAATMAALGEPPDEVVLAPPQSVLKTSSGKIRRAACRDLYEAGLVGRRGRAGWWQVARLLAGSLLPQARRAAGSGARAAYAGWVWLLFLLLAGPAWLATVLAPRPTVAWSANRLASRLLLALAGIRLTIRGLERIPAGPCVLVANHASYADVLILCAALPTPFSFVAKRELLDGLLTRPYLRGLGTQFVERFDARQSVEDARRLGEAVKAGSSSAFFPEGTFTRAGGLASFRLGAFAAAAAAGVPVLPVALAGTRSFLRDGQWRPRRVPVTVTIGDPVRPEPGTPDAFAAAVALRDAARAHILAHCGEPDAGLR